MTRLIARTRRTARGTVIIIVIWAIAIAALVTSSVQLLSFRQATFGHQSLGRVQARWAARAGVENCISIMSYHTRRPEALVVDAYALDLELQAVSVGELYGAFYDIAHFDEDLQREVPGPTDEHSRININSDLLQQALPQLEGMTPDTISAVVDWRDDDDEENFWGAEADFYSVLGYAPRNGNFRSIQELEPVAGVWPVHVRGEDWNYNNRLDPQENDGAILPPEDDGDGILRLGWGSRFTASTIEQGATLTGLPRLWLALAEPEELAERIGVELPAAEAIIRYSVLGGGDLAQLLFTPLSNVDSAGAVQTQATDPDAGGIMTPEQLQMLFAEVTTGNPLQRELGRLNINTVPLATLKLLFPEQEHLAEELIYLRYERPEGVTSLAQLQGAVSLTQDQILQMAGMLTTTSNVFTIASRGRSAATGLEVEIIAVVDRSSVPVRILEYREQ